MEGVKIQQKMKGIKFHLKKTPILYRLLQYYVTYGTFLCIRVSRSVCLTHPCKILAALSFCFLDYHKEKKAIQKHSTQTLTDANALDQEVKQGENIENRTIKQL